MRICACSVFVPEPARIVSGYLLRRERNEQNTTASNTFTTLFVNASIIISLAFNFCVRMEGGLIVEICYLSIIEERLYWLASAR